MNDLYLFNYICDPFQTTFLSEKSNSNARKCGHKNHHGVVHVNQSTIVYKVCSYWLFSSITASVVLSSILSGIRLGMGVSVSQSDKVFLNCTLCFL